LGNKYKPGDIVLIKTKKELKRECNFVDEKVDFIFDYDTFVFEMIKFCGKMVTIRDVFYDKNKKIHFYAIEQDALFSWYEPWFIESNKTIKILYYKGEI